mmetsp:Transcript_60380/g.97839  ORF Transcript_60380/g.97839 Transcript_60380/m.97839 type:complete len:509 (+) Transcript_60380:16-1542(+)
MEGKSSVNRSLLFSHEGNGHANPTEPQQAPASPGGHCSGAARWDLGEGGDASTMLKDSANVRYAALRGERADHPLGGANAGEDRKKGVSTVSPRRSSLQNVLQAIAVKDTHRHRRSHSQIHGVLDLGDAEEVNVSTPSQARFGVLLQHKYCPWDGTEFRPLVTTCPVCGASRTRSKYSGSNDKVLAQLLKPPWERVLWKKQPYEDNYVDRSFLESLVTNANFYTYDAWQITKDSIVVTQHLAGTAIFLAFTYMTNYQKLNLSYMLALDVFLAVGGACSVFLVWIYSSWQLTGKLGKRTPPLQFLLRVFSDFTCEGLGQSLVVYMRSGLLFIFALSTLSPILRTLTQTISDDTLAAGSLLFLTVNLFCHDYRWVNGRGNQFEGSVSLNAAMFVSVMLASRASSNMHVALLMCSAVEVFALAPRVYRTVKLMSETAHVVLSTLLILLCFLVLSSIRKIFGQIFGFIAFFITCICPLTFLYIQRYKNKINGPWDEAVPTRPNDKMGGGLTQ